MENKGEYRDLDELVNERLNQASQTEILDFAKRYRKNSIISTCFILLIILALLLCLFLFEGTDLTFIFLMIFCFGGLVIIMTLYIYTLYTRFTDRELFFKYNYKNVLTEILNEEIEQYQPNSRFKYIKERMKQSNIQKKIIKTQLPEDFVVTRELLLSNVGWTKYKVMIDEEKRQFLFKKGAIVSKIYNFTDLINYEVYENNNQIVSGRAGSSLVGGALFGLGGAIVGSSMSRKVSEKCDQLSVCIRLNDIRNPQILIEYIKNNSINKNSFIYKNARENLQYLCSLLECIMSTSIEKKGNHSSKVIENIPMSKKDELKELKEMLNDNLITNEEYETLKKKLLDL